MSTAEEQRLWRARHGARTGERGRMATAPCGTLAAHKRHVRHGEVPCEQCRLAATADRGFRRNKARWQRSDRFAWLLHRAVLDALLTDPDRVRQLATDRLAGQLERVGSAGESDLWAQWQSLLAGPLDELVAVMLGLDEAAKHLRSTTPFVGVVDDARRIAALEASKAA